MKLTVVLAVLVGTLVVACSTVTPTPNIDATIEARVGQMLTKIPTETPIPTPTLVPTATPVTILTPVPTATPVPTPTPAPTATPVPTPTPTPTPVPTPTPLPTSTPGPTSTPVPSSCAGKRIKFKIGNIWANESIVWAQGEVTELNLTASSTILPSTAGTSWPISAGLSPPAQRVIPHAVLGRVNAADGTSISAWYGDTQLTSKNASGGSYPVLLIEDGKCVSIAAPSVAP